MTFKELIRNREEMDRIVMVAIVLLALTIFISYMVVPRIIDNRSTTQNSISNTYPTESNSYETSTSTGAGIVPTPDEDFVSACEFYQNQEVDCMCSEGVCCGDDCE